LFESGVEAEDANNNFSFLILTFPIQQETNSRHGVLYNSKMVELRLLEQLMHHGIKRLVKHWKDKRYHHQHFCSRNKAPID
jgi:hypothetical protein